MIISMTGFGREVLEYKNKKISIDVKTLNSKTSDINTRIPSYYKEKELEIRKLLSGQLRRGKIDFCMFVELNGTENNTQINENAVVNYYSQLKDICDKNSIPMGNDVLSGIIKMPDVMQNKSEDLSDEEWGFVLQTIKNAIEACKHYRIAEGTELENDISTNIKSILSLLKDIPKFEEERITVVREKFGLVLEEFGQGNKIDENRLEQEIIYYLEKLDVNEEKVRLKKHCEYFLETLISEEPVGKILAFISQEIGREINTLGSKANHAEMQKVVVMMKDKLEKIKEQLLNVL
ncbi:MAG: YicC family protein [Bacteroidales bacterium]|nr:YicC family protein [Bacteroidales bacterium]